MKTILYIVLSVGLSLNSCNENKESKTISENKTETNISDTSVEKDAVSENRKEISADTILFAEKKTVSEKQKEHFKLINAVSESWTAGIPSGGSGTEYYIKIKITTDKIIFDTLWINNKAFEIFISKESSAVSSEPIKFGNGEVITVRASELKNQNTKTVTVNPPFNYNGAALLGYFVKGKREYFTIKEITKQSSPNRP